MRGKELHAYEHFKAKYDKLHMNHECLMCIMVECAESFNPQNLCACPVCTACTTMDMTCNKALLQLFSPLSDGVK